MIEHRVTIAVKYPIAGAMPSISETIDALKDADVGGYVELVSATVKSVRVAKREKAEG
jgi:hypothetical protein